MNQTKSPAIFKIFTIIALALVGFSFFLAFLRPIIYNYSFEGFLRVTFNSLLVVAPVALLFLFVLNLDANEKPYIFLVIMLGIVSFDGLLGFINSDASALNVIFTLPLIALCALTIVFTFTKGNAKLFGLLTAAVGMARAFIFLCADFGNVFNYMNGLYLIESLFASAGTIFAFVVLLLIAIKGYLPVPAEKPAFTQAQPYAQPAYAQQPYAQPYAQPQAQPTYAPQPQAQPVYTQPQTQPYAQPTYAAPQPQAQPVYAPQPQVEPQQQPQAQPVYVPQEQPVAPQPQEETPAE